MTDQTLKPHYLEILKLLYRFRFLSRPQIQQLLNHKNHSRILLWLNTLTTDEYIIRYYEKSITSIPAVYSLAPKGRKYLRDRRTETGVKDVVLKRVWREKKFSAEFRDKCLIVADIYLAVRQQTKDSDTLVNFRTKAEMVGFQDLIEPPPDAYFAIKVSPRKKKYYFVEVFGHVPARVMRKRIQAYIDYCDLEEWQKKVGAFPEVILVSPNRRLQTHLRRHIKTKMEYSYIDDLKFCVTTEELIKKNGFTLNSLAPELAGEDV